MKRLFLTLSLLLLAIGTGLFLPQVVMALTDRALPLSTETVAVTEPDLLKADDIKSQGPDLPTRLALFQSEWPTTVLMNSTTDEELNEAIATAAGLLEDITGRSIDRSTAWAEHQLAYFSDGSAFAFWEVWVPFEGTWWSSIILDGASGTPLTFCIRNQEADLSSLFLRQWEQSQNRDVDFPLAIGEHVSTVLGQFLSPLDYIPQEERLVLHSADGELSLPLKILPEAGLIAFNPSPQQLESWGSYAQAG